jgi:hypothetical protein
MVNSNLKTHWITILVMLLVAGLALGWATTFTTPVDASDQDAEGPQRKATITVSFTTYEWWLLTWSDSQVVCQIYIEHEGWPEVEEVQYFCGDDVLEDWLDTSPCVFEGDITGSEQCPGLYLYQVSVTPGEREIEIDLQPPEVVIDIANCDPQPPENRCNTLPSLQFTGVEPLPNEHIINIQGYIGAEPFNCEGSECAVPLPATGLTGLPVSFWAESSFGDSSETFTAQIRVIPWGDFVAPDVQSADTPQWYVDIISTQYMGEIESTCSQIWSSFPPVGGAPAWLASPDHPDGLVSTTPYYYLAASLINQGIVDASACSDGGLQSNQVASQCGLEAAREEINIWQNQFDSEIVQVAQDTGVPAQLLKNIFSRESQFWPGTSANYYEAGLGHLSDLGADTVLLWNPSFFNQFCPLVLDTEVCQRGFGNLDQAEQEMLRGALVQKVNAACPDCPMGIDLTQANFSISIFARSLLANCEQVGQIIYNTTRQKAGEVSFYEDLWRFTLVNYNAGPGCLTNAVQQAYNSRAPMTWENVSRYLEPACQTSIDYVEDIAFMPGVEVATPTAVPTEIINPQAPTLQPATPTPQPTPTPTQDAYPLDDYQVPTEAYYP